MENMRSIQYANVSQRRSRIDGFRTGLGYRTHQWDRFLRGKIVCRCGFLVICVLCFGGRDGHSAHAGDLHLAGVVHSGIGGVAGDRPGDSAPPAATIGTQGKFLPVDDRGAWLAGDGKSRLLRLANGKALRFCAGIVACTGDSYGSLARIGVIRIGKRIIGVFGKPCTVPCYTYLWGNGRIGIKILAVHRHNGILQISLHRKPGAAGLRLQPHAAAIFGGDSIFSNRKAFLL